MSEPAAKPPAVNVSALIDSSPISALTYRVLALTFLVTVTEGFEIAAAAHTAPGIMNEWGLTRPQVAPIFSATPLGMMAGATIFGFLGDRLGRKVAILAAGALFALTSLLCAAAPDLGILVGLRFMMGVAAGALMTNNIALIAEFAPARRRAAFVMIVAMGMTIGGLVVALTSSMLETRQWRLLYLIGGVCSLAMLPALAAWLPESIKFLVLRNGSDPRARALVSKLAPKAALNDGAPLVINEGPANGKASFAMIFAGKLAILTPLIWLIIIAIQSVNVGLTSWLPTVMQQDNAMSVHASAITISMFYVGGILGSLTIGRAMDRFGFVVLTGSFLLSIPAVLMIGLQDAPQWLRMLGMFLTGYAVLGTQLGSNTVSIFYPPAFRAIGYGTATAVGRIGGIGGPLVFAALMAWGLTLQEVLLAPAIALFLGAIAVVLVSLVSTGRLIGSTMKEVGVPNPTPRGAHE